MPGKCFWSSTRAVAGAHKEPRSAIKATASWVCGGGGKIAKAKEKTAQEKKEKEKKGKGKKRKGKKGEKREGI
jgi:hypothetical protein